jgi:hypothetical protein
MDAVSKYKPKKHNEVKLKCYLKKTDSGLRKNIRENLVGITRPNMG